MTQDSLPETQSMHFLSPHIKTPHPPGRARYGYEWPRIREEMLPTKTPTQLFHRKKNLVSSSSRGPNPVKTAMETIRGPLSEAEIRLISDVIGWLGPRAHRWEYICQQYLPARQPKVLSRLWSLHTGGASIVRPDKSARRQVLARQRRERHLRDVFFRAQDGSPLGALLAATPADEMVAEGAPIVCDADGGAEQGADAPLRRLPLASPPGAATAGPLSAPTRPEGRRALPWATLVGPSQHTMDAFAAGEALVAGSGMVAGGGHDGRPAPGPAGAGQPLAPAAAIPNVARPPGKPDLVAYFRHQLLEALAGGEPAVGIPEAPIAAGPSPPLQLPPPPGPAAAWSADEDRFLLRHCIAVMESGAAVTKDTLGVEALTRAVHEAAGGAAPRSHAEVETRCLELLSRFLTRLRARRGGD